VDRRHLVSVLLGHRRHVGGPDRIHRVRQLLGVRRYEQYAHGWPASTGAGEPKPPPHRTGFTADTRRRGGTPRLSAAAREPPGAGEPTPPPHRTGFTAETRRRGGTPRISASPR